MIGTPHFFENIPNLYNFLFYPLDTLLLKQNTLTAHTMASKVDGTHKISIKQIASNN